MHLTVRPVVRSLSLFSFAFLLCLAFSSESVARAATINVAAGQTAVAADGQCSLREAIINANNDAQTHADCPSGSGADTITLPAGTYTTDQGFSDEDFSAEGDLDIRSNITINGAGAGTTIIEAASTPGAASDRVLHVVSGTVVLNDLTVRNGKAPDGADAQSDCTDSGCHDSNGAPGGSGGGILNAGTLTLNRVTMTANRAGKGGKAGDVSCVGSEEELHSTNCSTSGGKGGGGGAVYSSGALTVNSGTFTNNHSGEGGAAGLTSCSGGASCSSWLGNKGDGGALFGGTLTVTESTFSGNAAYDGGAIQQNDAPVNISNSSFTGNTAEWTGGAMNCNSGAITCDISGSTFSGNNATGGYGGALAFFNGGVKTVTNSTVSGNTANQDGGGIVSHSGTLNLNFVTIAGNTCDNDNNGQGEGGGLQRVFATVNLKNSIIADNVDKGGQSHQIYGTITSQGYNHIEGTAGGTFTPTTGDIATGDPALTALAANGGPTSTRLPAYNSPVLDTIPLGTNGCASGAGAVTKDQRGATRATDGNADGVSGCDKGAAELGKLVGGIQAAAEPATYTFLSGANQVSLNVTNDGTNLDYLRVTDIAFNHPNATAPVQTGKYWIISGLRSDKTTQATADYTVNLTLPYATADSLDQVCRHSGGGVWDCAATSFAANASVTRTGVSQFSDWAVGDNEAPTDLEVTKKDSVDPVPLGSSFNYELRVYNRGPNVAEDVTVTDTIPAGLTVTGISMHATSDYTGAGCSFTGNTVTCSLGTMRVFDNTFDGAVKKGKALVYVNVTASQAGQYTNEANVSSGAPDPNSSNNAGRQTTTVLGLSSVEVTPGDVIGGANCQKATVRVTLTGIAPYDTYVEVSDDLAATTNIPASSSPAQLRIPAGQSSASLTINTVTVGAVQAGQVTASFGASASAPLTVRPNGVKWVQVSPSDIVGPGTVTATVNLECQPTEPLTVTLRSSKPFVARFVNPSNNTAANPVVVQMTTKQATFSVEAYAVDADTGINLSAQGADGVQRNVRLDVLKPTP